jgi:hypothetical protein
MLLEEGANVDVKDKDGWTALMRAAHEGNEPLIKLLLDNKADVNEKDPNGETALMTASERGHTAAARVLLIAGAEVNAESKVGGKAVTLASRNCHEEVVNLLLVHGANESDIIRDPSKEERIPGMVIGVVASLSPERLYVIPHDGEDENGERIAIRISLQTRFTPFRRPTVGETVKVLYETVGRRRFGVSVEIQ